MSRYSWIVEAGGQTRVYPLGAFRCETHNPRICLQVRRFYVIRKLADGQYLPTLQFNHWRDERLIVWGTAPMRLLRDAVAACDAHALETYEVEL